MNSKVLYEVKTEREAAPENIIRHILRSRKIRDSQSFLNPPIPTGIELTDFDPSYATQLKQVFALLARIRKKNGTIVVYTDYDADGITGGAILWETLHLLGFSVMPYVPHRVHEGYGFSRIGIDAVKKRYNPSLIISVDHGISAREQVAYAAAAGIPVIITDHHLKPDKIPDAAAAIFHIPALSGSGVAYVFARTIYKKFINIVGISAQSKELLERHFDTDYAALAAVGTIADLVPLVGPSRSIVYHGLKAFARLKRVGLRELIKSAGIDGKEITPYEIGFIIAPRINAIGRLEHAIDALRLLCTTSVTRASTLSTSIGAKNTKRQEMVRKAVDEALQLVRTRHGEVLPKLLIVESDTWHEGIIGLIASKLMDTYYRPVIVMTRADGYYKGSARSVPAVHITDFLRHFSPLFLSVGGHAQAAGFSLPTGNLNTFLQKAAKRAESVISTNDLVRTVTVDVKIPLEYVTLELTRHIERLAPFGVAHARPVFLSTVDIVRTEQLGKDRSHLKITSTNGMEFMYFGRGQDKDLVSARGPRDIIYTCEIDRWNGRERLRAKVVTM